MPTDAKCGLLVGVGVVLTVAALFFQRDPPSEPTPPAAVRTQAPSPAPALEPPRTVADRPAESSPLAPARPVSRVADDDDPLRTRLP